MKALIFSRTGAPSNVLEYAEIEKPVPGPNDVLVKMLASPIHPADSMFIRGQYRLRPEFHQKAGLEGAGIIEEAGNNVNIRKGTLVAFLYRNAWAEYVVIPKVLSEEGFTILPPDFPPEKASQFFVNPVTAWGLLQEARVNAGDWLLLTAGNSTVSKIAIQLAAIRKINTIAIVRNLRQTDELKTLGANNVLSIDDNNFQDKVSNLTEGKGVNAVLDSVGGKTGTAVLQSLSSNGKMIIYGLLDNNPVQYNNSQIIYKNIIIKGFGIRGYLQAQTKQQWEEMLQTLIHELPKPSFKLPVANAFSLEDFRDAFEANSKPNNTGKIVFKP